jgi:hypothetical protein
VIQSNRQTEQDINSSGLVIGRNAQTYNLHGEAITQYQVAKYLNSAFGTD